MKTFFRIIGYANFGPGLFIPYLLATLFYVAFSVINFTAIIPILEVLFDQVDATAIAQDQDVRGLTFRNIKAGFYRFLTDLITEDGKKAALLVICFIILISVFLSNLFRYLSDLILVKIRARIILNLRKDIYHHIIKAPVSFFSENRKAETLSRLTVDVQEIETSVIYTLKVFLKEPILILGYLTVLLSISLQLTLYTVALIPVSGIIIASIARSLKKKAVHSQGLLGDIAFIIDETISSMRIIKAFNAEGFMSAQFNRVNNHYARFSRSMGRRFQLAGPLSEFLGVGTMIILLALGGTMVIDETGALTASQFIGFLIIFSQVLAPVKAISQAHSLMQRGIASGNRVFEIRDKQISQISRKGLQPVSSFENSLQLRNVSFGYEAGRMDLKNVDLCIEKGRSYALVGASGSGKSTLVNLILGLYSPNTGQIELDGSNIELVDPHDYRDLFAVVTQETLLFHDTVLNNIRFNLDASEGQIIKAARMAHAHEFISRMKDGYQTIIGDKGEKLSGGERQRIAIARAILKDAPILILDEATSALDSDTEKSIRETLDQLMRSRTSIVITHRLNAIMRMDEIIILDDGKIMESGNHYDLIQSSDYYRRNVELFSSGLV